MATQDLPVGRLLFEEPPLAWQAAPPMFGAQFVRRRAEETQETPVVSGASTIRESMSKFQLG